MVTVTVIGRLLERRITSSVTVNEDPRRIPTNGEAGVVHAGEPVTDHTALNLVAFYAAVRLLADTVASLPWAAYRKAGAARLEVSPQPRLLVDPHPGDTGDETEFDFKHQMMTSLAIRGNFYGLIVRRDRLEYPVEVMPLHPDWVQRRREQGRVVTRIEGELVPNYDVLHIRGFTLPGAVEGLSPIGLARHAIGLGLAAQRWGSMWFRDSAAPSGQLVSDQPLDDAQVRRNQQMWMQTHGGRRLPAVLSGMKYEPITISPEESQFLGTRAFSTTEMARLVGVPPWMIGDVEKSTSWGTGIEQQSIGFTTYTLRSWLTRIESAFTRQLPRPQFTKFTVDGLLRGDVKTRWESYRLAIESGVYNPDEVRALEDLPPIPGGAGQLYRQPMNYAPLGFDPAEQGGES